MVVGGVTRTAGIDGISAAGENREVMVHTPSADLEIVEYGDVVGSPVVPVSPSGCPTPAVVTRAVRELVDFETVSIDAGLVKPSDAPTLDTGADRGDDIREGAAVPQARDIFEESRRVGRELPDDEIVVGETIPGGTTTALGVLRALGEPGNVSSSLPENPIELKREVVEESLEASGLEPEVDPLEAVRETGDPVLSTVAGICVGALESDKRVVLGGGTQMIAAAAVVRRMGYDEEITVATTPFVAEDETADVRGSTDRLDINLEVTDPEFETENHVVTESYVEGVAKEGVGMGGALMVAERKGVRMENLKERVFEVYEGIVDEDRERVSTTAR